MRRLHSGQSSILLLALLASLVAAGAAAFGSGQLVNDKMRLVNAADAAAYSAALWQARSLNYQAYLNRAIVANEVAIAQLVSLRSWSRYVDTVTTNIDRVTRYVPYLGPPMQAAHKLHEKVRSETGLPCSIGAGSSRLVAKIGSGLAKPNGVLWIEPGLEPEFLAPLDIKRIPGVGKVMQQLRGQWSRKYDQPCVMNASPNVRSISRRAPAISAVISASSSSASTRRCALASAKLMGSAAGAAVN